MDSETDIDPGQRILTIAHLRLTIAHSRAALTSAHLSSVRHLLREQKITSADAYDLAYELWMEFRGIDGVALDMPLGMQAGVFAQAAPFFIGDEATMIRLARETWGAVDMDAAHGHDRVEWMPADDVLIITTSHLHDDGSVGATKMLVTPSLASEWTR